jgi:uncharacterized coiled-coil protein SlyX
LFVLFKEKIGLTKSSESRLADEKRQLKRTVDEYEARVTDLEMNKRALEGEIQRLNMILTDKDTEILVHQERCDALIKQIQVGFAQYIQLSFDNVYRLFSRIAKKIVNHFN